MRKLGTGTPADTVYYAYVVYGRDERILQSVQSILDTEAMDLSHRSKESDMHTETLAILPVLDGVDDSVSSVLKQKLKHQLGPSSLPIHLLVYSQEEQVGVARSRLKAVEFIEMLASKSHISEDKIVLVLVRGDAVLKPKWMDPVLELEAASTMVGARVTLEFHSPPTTSTNLSAPSVTTATPTRFETAISLV